MREISFGAILTPALFRWEGGFFGVRTHFGTVQESDALRLMRISLGHRA